MGKLTVALVNEGDSQTTALVELLAANEDVDRILLIDQIGEQPALTRASAGEGAGVKDRLPARGGLSRGA